ncbi:MAG: DNA-3-methyladenine glycosylase 2 family protein [Provencibacterium sp.]|jgi:N-glycosylase/DNA lyase|nr:DNA-3-methyladenine glycosylase 2 family protein [Provencibacterium sp.]
MPHLIHLPLHRSADFDPAQTLDCGQAFRFRPAADGWWEGVAGGRFCRIRREEAALAVECWCPGGCEPFWEDYFDLCRDYGALKEELACDSVLQAATGYCPGIRLLRQDAWEALCTFILSQNNHIARIRRIVQTLCLLYGPSIPAPELSEEDAAYSHGFPSPAAVAALDEEALSLLRAGFRAKYIHDAAVRVAAGEVDLLALRTLPVEKAREQLRTIYGVGPKVAECALLYGCGRAECFPQDVWINRALAQLYPQGFPEAFTPVAGLAQQYLFHYCRTCPEALEKSASTK